MMTLEQIEKIGEAYEAGHPMAELCRLAKIGLRAETITDDMVERAAKAFWGTWLLDCFSDAECDSALNNMRAALTAALGGDNE